MRVFHKVVVLMVGIVSFAYLFTSCFKDKDQEEFKLESVQIVSLRLFSQDLPELSNTFFSIDHNKGIIFNAFPLPYKSNFGLVKLKIGTDTYNSTKVFVGDEERNFTQTDSIDLSGWEKGIRLEIFNKKADKKVYQLNIHRYNSDPLVFNWKKQSISGLPDDVNSWRLITGKRYAYMVGDEQSVYCASKEQPSQWKKVCSFQKKSLLPLQVVEGEGAEQGVFYSFAIQTKNVVSLIKSKISADANSFDVSDEYVLDSGGNSCVNTLGAFTEPGEMGARLALIIVSPQNSEHKFATQVVRIQNDEIKSNIIVGEPVPEGFSQEGTPFLVRQSREAYHDKIQILGVASTDANNAQIWSTTSGLDWLTIAPSSAEMALPFRYDSPSVMTFDLEENRYILFDVKGDQKSYVSVDGINWKKGNDAIILPKSPSFQTNNASFLGFAISSHRMVLISIENKELWMGLPAMYEKN